jgi:hypothetical protein
VPLYHKVEAPITDGQGYYCGLYLQAPYILEACFHEGHLKLKLSGIGYSTLCASEIETFCVVVQTTKNLYK